MTLFLTINYSFASNIDYLHLEKQLKTQIRKGALKKTKVAGIKVNDYKIAIELANQLTVKKHKSIKKDLIKKCLNSDCILKSIFGKRESTLLLALLYYHHVNASYIMTNGPKITLKNLETLFQSFQHFTKVKNGEKLLRKVSHSIRIQDNSAVDCSKRILRKTASASAGLISLYSNWLYCLPEKKRIKSIIHEVGHSISASFNYLALAPSWTTLSRWQVLSRYNHKRDNTACFISLYAKVDAYEDFAESFLNYVYDPLKLKNQCSEKFTYMDKLFSRL